MTNPNSFFYIHSEKIFDIAKQMLPSMIITEDKTSFALLSQIVLDEAEEFVKEWEQRREKSRKYMGKSSQKPERGEK